MKIKLTFSVVFFNLARGRVKIKLPAGKTDFLCSVPTVWLGPKLVKQNVSVVFFELGRGRPQSVLPAAWYFPPDPKIVPELTLDASHTWSPTSHG